MSNEGSIPSGRAAPESLENQQLSDRATGQGSSAWSGLGPKVGQWVRCLRTEGGGFQAKSQVMEVDCCGRDFRTDGCGIFVTADRGKTWDFTLEDLALMDDVHATHGKGGVPELPAVPEVRRCRGLVEFNHTWTCEAVLGPDEGEQCAHCHNLEAQIRREDLAVEETERRDAEQALAYEQLLVAHQGDAQAVVSGVLRTLVQIGQLTAEDEHGLRASASNVINQAFLHAKELTGLPLMVFWSLVADLATAERNSLRRAGAELFRGCA